MDVSISLSGSDARSRALRASAYVAVSQAPAPITRQAITAISAVVLLFRETSLRKRYNALGGRADIGCRRRYRRMSSARLATLGYRRDESFSSPFRRIVSRSPRSSRDGRPRRPFSVLGRRGDASQTIRKA